VPSDDKPTPGLIVELVVSENGVPAPPVLVVGKKSSLTVPEVAIAPPPVDPNGSAVVFASARPVSNGANVIAYGINSVVCVGKMLTTVIGPTSASVKHGKPFDIMATPAPSRLVVQNGAMLAVTVIAPGVVTAAVLDNAMPVISISNCGVEESDPLRISRVAVFVAVVIWAVPEVVGLAPVPLT